MNKENETQIVNVEEVRDAVIIAAEIRMIVGRTREYVLGSAIEVGRRLTEAKELVAHGEWGKWIEDNFEFSQRNANRMMQLFEQYSDSQGTLLGATVNSPTLANLSYSKALELLALPADEREAFAEEVDAEHISIKELREKIRKLEEEKESLGDEYVAVESDYKMTKDQLTETNKKLAAVEAQVRALTAAAENATDEDIQAKIEEALTGARKDLEKAEKAKEAVQKKLDKLQAEQAQAMEEATARAAEEAKAAARAESEKELAAMREKADAAVAAATTAEKRLAASADAEKVRFAVLVENVQTIYQEITRCIGTVREKDEAQADKMKDVALVILEKLKEELQA